VRNPETGIGVVIRDTDEEARKDYCLTDDQVAELADLGRRVQAAYGEFPQDTGWAFASGQFYLLQARPVTGVELPWDAEVKIWSRTWADEAWTGAITPLMYSWRVPGFNIAHSHWAQSMGLPELNYDKMKLWHFHKSQVYWNPQLDRETIREATPPFNRAGALQRLPMSWREYGNSLEAIEGMTTAYSSGPDDLFAVVVVVHAVRQRNVSLPRDRGCEHIRILIVPPDALAEVGPVRVSLDSTIGLGGHRRSLPALTIAAGLVAGGPVAHLAVFWRRQPPTSATG
jgi:hypothetical protein